MIRCKPMGLCSWNFYLDGEGHQATLEFRRLTEQGAITWNGKRHEIRKHGVLSGRWTMELAGAECASAQKSTPFTRTFEVVDTSGGLTLRAASPFGRSFRLEHGGVVIATMFPDHPFTRRARIKLHTDKWDFNTVSFSFWLVVLTWRRAAKNSSSGG